MFRIYLGLFYSLWLSGAVAEMVNETFDLTASLGPGSGPWTRVAAESVGLSSPKLQIAGKKLEKSMAVRHCLIVVRHGQLVHNEYYGQAGPTDKYEADSMMKTAVALVMGVACTKGLFDLDTPIFEYGVKPLPTWTANSSSWPLFFKVTARHLLTQTSGWGVFEPGSHFTYSSGNGIQHLERLLAAVIGHENTTQWANANFGDPLGLPDLFSEDGPQFSAGGGQRVTCQGMARVGQLVVNKGKWKAADGSHFQLVSQEYVSMMTSPYGSSSYGFLTWLWRPPAHPNSQYPRWGTTATCPSEIVEKTSNLYGLDRIAYVSPGWLAKLMVVLPEDDMVVVSFGNTLVGSSECDIRFGPFGRNMDDSYSVYLLVQSLHDSLPSKEQLPSTSSNAARTDLLVTKTDSPALPSLRGIGTDLTLQSTKPAEVIMDDGALTGHAYKGSCTCNCIPDQGFGSCFAAPVDVDSDEKCSLRFNSFAAARCPDLGIVQECRVENKVENGSLEQLALVSNMCETLSSEGDVSCTSLRECGMDDLMLHDRSTSSAACVCKTTRVVCVYDNTSSCSPSDPYTPLVDVPSQLPTETVFGRRSAAAFACICGLLGSMFALLRSRRRSHNDYVTLT
eukprot:TRINITY_DN19212_c0_g1_i1.p1 TRINITY_DN19212_c0_g1~~TRINITY_DN19212_c0_g1_i1.p1  ORF type:complete len:619 (-),score=51.24 TRINITY_DN19212_c0_g1_i1:220-2076(-)